MSQTSSIEWTDATWNPVRGCTKVSAGCAYCYAERFAERFRGIQGHPYEEGFEPRLAPERVFDPLSWIRPRTIFVNSMSDLFHEVVPDEYIVLLARIMMAADWHTFQILTKRSERMARLLRSKLSFTEKADHIWWGISMENRKQGLPRLEHLRSSPAAVRFVSAEPLLENLGPLDLAGIHWLIVGGESGPGARPIDSKWVVNLRDQCEDQNVAFFFKQWGGVQKSRNGRLLNGRTFDEMPERYRTLPAKLEERRELISRFGAQLQRLDLQRNGH